MALLFVPLDIAAPASPPPTRPAAPPPSIPEDPVVDVPVVADDAPGKVVVVAWLLTGAATVRDWRADSPVAEMGSLAKADATLRGSSVEAVDVIAGALVPTAEVGSWSKTPRDTDFVASVEDVTGSALVLDDVGSAAAVFEP